METCAPACTPLPLQPRDLRRIDPTIDFTKTSPSITIKENVLLLCLGGVRSVGGQQPQLSCATSMHLKLAPGATQVHATQPASQPTTLMYMQGDRDRGEGAAL